MSYVTCPSCGGSIQRSAELAAQQVACPHCAQVLVMPPVPPVASIPRALPGPFVAQPKATHSGNRGCVLIGAVLVGCAVVGLLGVVIVGSLVTVSFVRMQQVAYINATKSQVLMLEDAVNMYVLAIGEPPTQRQGLEALIMRPNDLPEPQKWEGPYLDKTMLPLDPWNRPYQYELLNTADGRFRIWSNGPDMQPGTADDISTNIE